MDNEQKDLQKIVKDNIPPIWPRIFTALQFSVMGTLLLCIIIALFGYLAKIPLVQNMTFWLLFVVCGIICLSPFFYVSNSRLGITELKRGMYTLKEATVLGVNESGILIETAEKKIALSNPLLLNITFEQLQTKKLKVVYIHTLSGKDFLTIL